MVATSAPKGSGEGSGQQRQVPGPCCLCQALEQGPPPGWLWGVILVALQRVESPLVSSSFQTLLLLLPGDSVASSHPAVNSLTA